MSKQETQCASFQQSSREPWSTFFGTIWDPLFKVNEVNKILKIADINDILIDIDETLVVKRSDDEMLTEQGLYALAISSKKEVAKELRIF